MLKDGERFVFLFWFLVLEFSFDLTKKIIYLMYRYNGMHAQIVKAVLCQAILFVGKEEFSAWTLALFVWMAKRRNTAALLK